MHPDYAKEIAERYESDSSLKGDSRFVIDVLACEPEFLDLAVSEIDDCDVVEIAQKIRDLVGDGLKRLPPPKVTSKMKRAVTNGLLYKYGHHRAVIAAAFNVGEAELFSDMPAPPPFSMPPKPSAETIAKRQHEAEEYAAKAAFIGLPSLKGSPKQIAWAETIRGQFIGFLPEKWAKRVLSNPQSKKASFWIDHRDAYFASMVEQPITDEERQELEELAGLYEIQTHNRKVKASIRQSKA